MELSCTWVTDVTKNDEQMLCSDKAFMDLELPCEALHHWSSLSAMMR